MTPQVNVSVNRSPTSTDVLSVAHQQAIGSVPTSSCALALAPGAVKPAALAVAGQKQTVANIAHISAHPVGPLAPLVALMTASLRLS
ncbi:MAG: hypothetical protein DMF89_12790 [Acidobacteria bacterium]|nr:MAG: hypothetical protein DMF89_12790 [Acidobacteriota bacterium]